MALRLILVGVVASLALDLPRGDVRPVATRAIRSILVAEPASHAPDAGKATLIASEPQPAQANPPLSTEVTIKPAAPVATIRPTVTVEPSLPVAAPELVVAVPPSPLPSELALLPILDDAAPAPAPMPMPMPMPPVLEVVSAPISPTAGAVPAPAPIPTTVAVDPMTPPSAIVAELSPEAAPAPAPAVAESETPAVAADPDAAFRKIVAKMASTFAADLPAAAPAADPKPLIARVETPPVAAPAPAPAEEVVAEAQELDLYPGVAFALNREAEGLAPIEAMARAEPTPAPVPVIEPSRADRLSQAVKLTGQALDAWAGLLSQRTPSSAVQR